MCTKCIERKKETLTGRDQNVNCSHKLVIHAHTETVSSRFDTNSPWVEPSARVAFSTEHIYYILSLYMRLCVCVWVYIWKCMYYVLSVTHWAWLETFTNERERERVRVRGERRKISYRSWKTMRLWAKRTSKKSPTITKCFVCCFFFRSFEVIDFHSILMSMLHRLWTRKSERLNIAHNRTVRSFDAFLYWRKSIFLYIRIHDQKRT